MLHSKQNCAGFTLLEVIIVIAITLILSAISVAALSEFANKSGHTQAAHVVLGALEEAQSRTLASDGDTVYGVHFGTDMVVLFEGASYTSGDPDNNVRPLPSKTSITNISLGGGSEVLFERLSGNVSPTGTITVALTEHTGTNKTVIIHRSGLVEINN